MVLKYFYLWMNPIRIVKYNSKKSTRTVTGGAPSIINVNNPGTAGVAGAFTFANTTAYPTTCFNVNALLSGNGGAGGAGDGATWPSGQGGFASNPGAVFVFTLY